MEREVRPGQVVRQARLAGGLTGLVGDLPVQDEFAVVVPDDHRRAGLGQRLAVANGEGERLGHARGALDGRRARGVGAACVDAGEELGLRGEHDAGLAEGGQHFADVAQEGRVGAHDQDRPLGQQLTVLVQQEGRPVQRDRGLAGAGAALDDEDAAVRGADDAVLVGLDGPHDVGHAAGAGRVEGGQQHGVAGAVLEAAAVVVLEVEDLVVQFGDPAALGGDVPAPAQTHGGVPGGEVERPGDRCAPVDQERGVVGVVLTDPDAADVVRGAAGEVDPAEAQRAVDRVEGRQQPGPLGDEDIAFQTGLHAAAHRGQRVVDVPGGDPAQRVDPLVEPVDEFLLLLQFDSFAS